MMKALITTLIVFCAQAKALSTSALTAWSWRMEDATGMTSAPTSGYLSGTFAYVPGKFGKGVQFSTSDGGFSVNSQTLTPFVKGAITISFWIKPTANGVYIFAFGSTATSNCFPYAAIVNSDNTMTVTAGQAGVTSISATTPALNTGAWTHVVITHSTNGVLKVYLNGAVQASNSTPIPMSASTDVTRLQLGSNAFTGGGGTHCNGLAGTYFSGYLDEFQIYAKELSAGEVRRLMLNYSPGE